jgi:hypothetical protein
MRHHSRTLAAYDTSPRRGEVGSRSDPDEGDRISKSIAPLTRNRRAERAHSDRSPAGRGGDLPAPPSVA